MLLTKLLKHCHMSFFGLITKRLLFPSTGHVAMELAKLWSSEHSIKSFRLNLDHCQEDIK
jgi:hypothetical protein